MLVIRGAYIWGGLYLEGLYSGFYGILILIQDYLGIKHFHEKSSSVTVGNLWMTKVSVDC